MGLYFPDKPEIKNIRKLKNNQPHTVSILGCGWLGLPLAEYLVNEGYFINGSTTTDAKIVLLKNKGINPYLLKLNPEMENEDLEDFFEADVLIINIPPSLRRSPPGHHIKQIQSICKAIQDPSIKVIFISSTSVYPENDQLINESGPVEVGHELFQVEQILKETLGQNVTILRCGGLMGYERIPGKYFAGKKEISGGNNPVNYVHRDDVIKIINVILKRGYFGELFNLVAPVHPRKKDVCIKTARIFEMEVPHFKDEKAKKYKIVNSDKLINTLQYSFKYPDPMDFFYKL